MRRTHQGLLESRGPFRRANTIGRDEATELSTRSRGSIRRSSRGGRIRAPSSEHLICTVEICPSRPRREANMLSYSSIHQNKFRSGNSHFVPPVGDPSEAVEGAPTLPFMFADIGHSQFHAPHKFHLCISLVLMVATVRQALAPNEGRKGRFLSTSEIWPQIFDLAKLFQR